MDAFVREAKRREDALTTRQKFVAAEQTAAVSARGIAVGEGRPRTRSRRSKPASPSWPTRSPSSTSPSPRAKDYRLALEAIVKQITAQEDDLPKQIDGDRDRV